MFPMRDKLYRWMLESSPRSSTGSLIEPLESRRLFSGATLGPDGILTVIGSDSADDIRIYKGGTDNSKVIVSGTTMPEFGHWSWFGGEFDLSAVRGIRAYGLGGDDLIYIRNSPAPEDAYWTVVDLTEAGKLNIPVTLDGGAGDDDLSSESNADDVIIGGPGWDHGYAIDGHDLFAVDMVENYRDLRFWYDQNGNFIQGYGSFVPNNPDQLIPDPYLSPNRNGTYYGYSAPHFDNSNPASDSGAASGGQSDQQQSAPVPAATTSTTTKGDAGTAAALPPPVVFSATKIDPKHDAVWDDLAA